MMVPINVPYKMFVSSKEVERRRESYKRGAELECCQKESSVFRRAALLYVKLREGHEISVGQPNQKSADIQGTNRSGGHHYNV